MNDEDIKANESDSQEIEQLQKEDLNCRFYENEYPEVDELVMVEICSNNEDGAYVKLLEYNDEQALILAANVSRKRVKNVKKHLKLGHQEVMQVISVDRKVDGAFIDLSKRTLQGADIEEKKINFEKAKQVHLILRLTAFQLQCKLLELYEEFGFKLYEKYDHAYDGLKLCLQDQDKFFNNFPDMNEKTKEALVFNIRKKLAAQPIKLRSTFSLQCFTYHGVEAIKESLLEAKKQISSEKFKLVFQLEKPPEYKVEVVTLEKAEGTQKIEEAIGVIEKEIKQRNGTFKLLTKVQTIGAKKDLDCIAYESNSEINTSDEDNEAGMDIDLENDDDIIKQDDEEDDDQIKS